MKKICILFALILFTATSISAQFGVQAGGTIANMQWESDVFSLNTKIKPGMLAGVTYDIVLGNSMAVNTALNYKHGGTWIHDGNDILAARLNYINLDVTYNYIFNIADLEIYAEGGGYIGYLVSGKTVLRPEDGDKVEEDLNIGTDEAEDDIKPLDIGFTIGAGIYMGNFKFGIGYQHGILGLSPNEDVTMHNRNGYIRVAYIFGRTK